MKKVEKYSDFNVWANAEAFLLGFILIGAQIILLREFMLVFMGNELVIGLLLALWMFISGAGAWSGKFLWAQRISFNLIPFLFLLLIIFPLVSAFFLSYFRDVFFETGRMISFYETLAYSFILLFPTCFIGGLLFTLLNYSTEKGGESPQKMYAYESLGSLAGGVLVGVVFIYLQGNDNFQSLEHLALISFLFLGILSFRRREIVKSTGSLFFAILVLLLAQFSDLSMITRQFLFPNQMLISSTDTPYGSLDITQTGSQQNVYENGILIFATDNVIGKEEDVHYAMLQKPNAKQVLLLGGGMTGTLFEILKYKEVEQIDYLEINPFLFELVEEFSNKAKLSRICTINKDPVLFVKSTTKTYDVILINEAAPASAQSNRFYTIEFYKGLKSILKEGGLISARLPASENYLSDEELELESVIYKSLAAVFKEVIPVPGKQHYFLASGTGLSLNYSELLAAAKISNQFVNESYLNDRLLKMRSEALLGDYLKNVPLNHDYKPAVYLVFIKQWLHFYHNNFQPLLMVAVFLLFLLFAKPNVAIMFTSGFTGASAEIILFIAFQSMLGYLYLFLGLMIAVFMGGLAVGAFVSRYLKMTKKTTLLYVQLASGLFLLIIPILLYLTKMLSVPILIQTAFGLMMFVVAFLVGLQYGSIFQQKKSNSERLVSRIYPADLLGAGLGGFITALWLIPVWGIYYSLIILAALHFITIGLVIVKRNKL